MILTRSRKDHVSESRSPLTAKAEGLGAYGEVDLPEVSAEVSPTDLKQVQDQGPIQLNKTGRGKLLLPDGHRLPDDHAFAIGQCDRAVVTVRLDEGDVPGRNPTPAPAGLDEESLLAPRGQPINKGGAKSLPQAVDSLVKPQGVDGLDQIIDGPEIERLKSELIVGRDENDQGTLAPKHPCQIEPALLMHPNIEEYHLRSYHPDSRNSGVEVGCFANNGKVRMPSQLIAKHESGQPFIIDHKTPDGFQGFFSGGIRSPDSPLPIVASAVLKP
jgi:hypothetical protein